ncbi:formyltransferase [Herbaspirillum seropedicae]|uniref:formyltransferase n=1 Tax=Herbaspirillum seropedicae TaxID=964 RepID=UPI0011203200|nr:formyltransferase [Herbaspirillum seropedicae]QDD64499.1 formyltransferase [Herbaspirillum seropedicae]
MNAVVFAYHDVGVRCLKVLLARGVQVSLVVTHEDSATENIWFGSVAGVCREHGIAYITPADPKSPQLLAQVQAAQPDFIFSFYYRHMLPVEVLAAAKRGAYNMHGSLLPKYRGRVPINWAVLHGETETGATLHEMTVKPDAGAIVAQTAVPILPDDTAHEVFGKVVVAAELTLWNVLPAMLSGRTPSMPNDLSKGSYYGGRKPEDGRIDWRRTAREVHNLVRAVAPPYPGAFEEIADDKITVTRTRLVPPSAHPALQRAHGMQDKFFEGGKLYARCGDGNFLQILGIQINDQDASLNNYLKYMAS